MTPCLESLAPMSSHLDFLIQVQQSCYQVPYWRLCQGLRAQQGDPAAAAAAGGGGVVVPCRGQWHHGVKDLSLLPLYLELDISPNSPQRSRYRTSQCLDRRNLCELSARKPVAWVSLCLWEHKNAHGHGPLSCYAIVNDDNFCSRLAFVAAFLLLRPSTVRI